MDLSPFKRINPCGYQHLVMTQLSDLGGPSDLAVVKPLLIENILQEFVPTYRALCAVSKEK
jgi:lipoyl(octanoyl) transferase